MTSLLFQQMEIDQEHNPSRNAFASRLFGVTEDGHSVVCYVKGFFPYFYCLAPDGFKEENVPQVVAELNCLAQSTAGGSNSGDAVVAIDMCMKEPLFGYHGNSKAPFFKIIVHGQEHIETVSQVLKSGFKIPGIGFCTATAYETNIDFAVRFMADKGIVGTSWVELPAGKYSVRNKRSTFCQYEVDIEYKDLIAHEPVGDWSKVAPLRILSLDIECAGRPGIFPEAKTDPVIQIANVVTLQGRKQPFIRNVFTLDTCAPIPGVHVLSFQDEGEMLLKWSQFVQACDPDVIIGYNTAKFDLPYLLDRAKKLGIADFSFNRIRDVAVQANKDYSMEGRVHFDVLAAIRREYKLPGYKLNDVSLRFLDERKVDMAYSDISRKQNGSSDTRQQLAIYCLQDAVLPQRLADKLMLIHSSIMMARVLGVSLNILLSRGSIVGAIGLLLRYSSRQGLVMQVSTHKGGDCQFEGTAIIKATNGYHESPIATLRLVLLGPSIIMAQNLCYTTMLTANTIDRLKLVHGDDYTETPSGDLFVKPTKQAGLLPRIFKDLFTESTKLKAAMAMESDPVRLRALKADQLILKVCADSLYKFIGALHGGVPCLAIPDSVTAFSHDTILKLVKDIGAQCDEVKRRKLNTTAIYADSDSIVVEFGQITAEEAAYLGREVAKRMASTLGCPINAELESVNSPCLIISKTYRGGMRWMKTDNSSLETVHRDDCPLEFYARDIEDTADMPTIPDSSTKAERRKEEQRRKREQQKKEKDELSKCLGKLQIRPDDAEAVEYIAVIVEKLREKKIDLPELIIAKPAAGFNIRASPND
ncbi:DNA-directed DNA polymerase delta [Coemansia sp. S100]|nr:DNA-directed DNA polymerase delta [Coemansia sp. S17]KAJ2097241.1 DNA-directed DNA polymerase delta [Coemansia sp. S100]KAJ2106975.1 DNA-directed DNA polymerase delta [Coemansia sp. S142-1]